MNVNFPTIPPSHGRPDHAGNAAAGRPTSTQSPAPASPAVVVDISTAETEPTEAPQAPGKSAMSPAHQAKAMLAEAGIQSFGDATVKLGQVVSALARGLDVSALLSPAVADDVLAEEIPAEEVPAETGETDTALAADEGVADETVPVVEEEDPAIIVEEPVDEEETVVAEEPAADETIIEDLVEEIIVSDVDTDGMLLDELEENTTDQV